MANHTSTSRIDAVRIVGSFAVIAGVAALLVYPLSAPPTTGPHEVPDPRAAPIVLPSLVIGPILVTWGVFSLKDGSFHSLTVRRALIVPFLAGVSAVVGLGRFVYQWQNATPFQVYQPSSPENPTIINPSVVEILQKEFHASHFMAIAALGAFLTGAATARRGTKVGFMSGSFSVVILGVLIALPVSATPPEISLSPVGALAAGCLIAIAFGAGYGSTKKTGAAND